MLATPQIRKMLKATTSFDDGECSDHFDGKKSFKEASVGEEVADSNWRFAQIVEDWHCAQHECKMDWKEEDCKQQIKEFCGLFL